MDSLTHIVIGACAGEILLGKKLGKKALLLGAIANSLPDIDILAALWVKPSADLLAHRGFTHSLLFAWLVSGFLAMVAGKILHKREISRQRWFLFFVVQIHLHLFLDCFNAYGTGLFEPFNHYRVSFNALFVADPLFTIAPLIISIILVVKKFTVANRDKWAIIGLAFSTMYLFSCLFNKMRIDHQVRNYSAAEHIRYSRYFTTPTPLNNLLWYVVLENDSGYYTGYRSVMDRQSAIGLTYFPKNNFLLKGLRDSTDLRRLIRFSKGYYSVEQWNDTLVFNDLRFGQVIGWADPHARFVFHYFLRGPDDNALVVQRGRFANWNAAALRSMIEKIKGR